MRGALVVVLILSTGAAFARDRIYTAPRVVHLNKLQIKEARRKLAERKKADAKEMAKPLSVAKPLDLLKPKP